MTVHNPSIQKIQDLSAKHHNLRGMITSEDDVYIWPEYEYMHREMEKMLDVTLMVGFYIERDGSGMPFITEHFYCRLLSKPSDEEYDNAQQQAKDKLHEFKRLKPFIHW